VAEKRLLYFTSRQVCACRWMSGRLEIDALFANKEESIAEFSKYVASARNALYYLLVDVIEEDFHQENIPYVRGRDRRTLLARKLAQRYRDVSLALTLSLGYETGPRREEKVLFSSFTNTQQFQPWLATLRACQARLAGVFSVPLVSPLVGKRAGVAASRYLLVSLQRAGLRQSYVENGQIRFSRLGLADPADAAEIARQCATESARMQQYLTSVRIVPRDAGPLDIAVLAPSDQVALFRTECRSNAQLRFQVLDLDSTCRNSGLKSAPEGLLGERLFLHELAAARPGEQFAQEAERRFYNIWRARLTLNSAGVAVFLFCVLLAGLRLMDAFNAKELAQADTEQARALSAQYAKLQTQFPQMPASSENLKGLVANYRTLEHQNASLALILGELSRALSAAPQIEVERIDWRVGVAPRAALEPQGHPPAPAAAGQPPAADSDRDYQVVEISARVNAADASDYRNITLLVDRFVETLRQQPGLQVISTRLPFDIAAEKSLSGDIGDERAAEVPRFKVLAAKRLGS